MPRHLPWLDTTAYPFTSHYLSLPMGKMHYVDEGAGEPIVLLHGNPSWSFTYRQVIKALKPNYRCIAPDHIGFGLSDKPYAWDYLPESHAQNLATFIGHLNLDHFTLVVNDWGGPIGMSYALKYPEKVKKLVVANSWCWPLNGKLRFEIFGRFMGSRLGRWLCEKHNFFAKTVTQLVMGDRPATGKNVYQHYHAHLAHPNERKGTWVFPQQLIASGQWLEDLWGQRNKITHKPLLLIWGMKDPGFRKKALQKWRGTFENSHVVKLKHVGHFPQEEASGIFSEQLEVFLNC